MPSCGSEIRVTFRRRRPRGSVQVWLRLGPGPNPLISVWWLACLGSAARCKARFKSGQFFVIMCDIDSGAAGRRDARALGGGGAVGGECSSQTGQAASTEHGGNSARPPHLARSRAAASHEVVGSRLRRPTISVCCIPATATRPRLHSNLGEILVACIQLGTVVKSRVECNAAARRVRPDEWMLPRWRRPRRVPRARRPQCPVVLIIFE